MKLDNLIQKLRSEYDTEKDALVIVDTSDRDGALIAAFLSSAVGKERIISIRAGSNAKE